MEYSCKWNTRSSSPEVRYYIESIAQDAGTSRDPLNFRNSKTILNALTTRIAGLDLTLFNHFAEAFKLDDLESHIQQTISSTFLAFEHLKSGFMAKAYFLPTDDAQGNPPSLSTFVKPVRAVYPDSPALEEVLKFLSTNTENTKMTADMLAVDCIDPAKSRLKLYVGSSHTLFESIVSTMTLGGNIKCTPAAINDLVELFRLVLDLGEEFSWKSELSVQNAFDQGLAHPFDLYGKMIYYFDIAPGTLLPDVKLYIPVCRFGKSDLAVANGLKTFLDVRGRGKYTDGFIRVLDKLAEGHDRRHNHRVQTFIACAFQGGSLSLTSYMNPGFYHARIKEQNENGS
jgi:DMATS type aromatic prenyltransferase